MPAGKGAEMAGKRPTSPTKKQLWYYQQRQKHPSIRATAKACGVNYSAVRNALLACQYHGLAVEPERHHPHIPVGHQMGKVTTQINYQVDPDGKVVQEWVRSTPAEQSLEELIEYLQNRLPANPLKLKKITNCHPDLMLQIDLADVHYGQLSWGKETGEDYDMEICRSLVLDTMQEIFSRSGHVKETLLVLYGDNFHADFFDALTERSRHALDVDSRYPKMVLTGADTYITAIEIAAANSERVRVIVLYGNHDKQTSVNLQAILHTHFRLVDPERVTIDLEPTKARYHVWGCTAQIFHHGDGTTPARLCADVLAWVAQNDIVGVREYRANQAHLHREETKDINGVIYECKSSPVAKDAYARAGLYNSKRACKAMVLHKRLGELSSYVVTPRQLRLKTEVLMEAA